MACVVSLRFMPRWNNLLAVWDEQGSVDLGLLCPDVDEQRRPAAYWLFADLSGVVAVAGAAPGVVEDAVYGMWCAADAWAEEAMQVHPMAVAHARQRRQLEAGASAVASREAVAAPEPAVESACSSEDAAS